MTAVTGESVFNCRMCGHCCEGRGGIVVSPSDMTRLAAHMQLPPEQVAEQYCERIGGKLKIRCGDDGYCVFFHQGSGCGVHEGKPSICRAWPFFRGNIEDAASLAMAKEFCPGIEPDAKHAQFALEGREYLQENGLLASDSSCEANALILK
jgi:uncharacterized protein